MHMFLFPMSLSPSSTHINPIIKTFVIEDRQESIVRMAHMHWHLYHFFFQVTGLPSECINKMLRRLLEYYYDPLLK